MIVIESNDLNSIREKYRIGKEINELYPDSDTFNSKDNMYTDFCSSIEINGKDLVLEDRYEYLYPNNVSLCENNCSVYYTDYELARVNCKCNYKEVFDFNREQTPANDLLNDPNFVAPSQSGANAEIIKCLSEFSVKDAITAMKCCSRTKTGATSSTSNRTRCSGRSCKSC